MSSAKINFLQVLLSYDFDPSTSRTMDPNTLELVGHQSCLHLCAELHDFEQLTVLGTESKILSDINVADADGNTVLHAVAEINSGTPSHQKAFIILLDKGIAPDARNGRGVTALHLLCANRSFSEAEMIEPLIEVLCTLLLPLSSSYSRVLFLQLLLNMGCNPNARDASGCTPLIIACAHREWSVCEILLQFGADMNVSLPL